MRPPVANLVALPGCLCVAVPRTSTACCVSPTRDNSFALAFAMSRAAIEGKDVVSARDILAQLTASWPARGNKDDDWMDQRFGRLVGQVSGAPRAGSRELATRRDAQQPSIAAKSSGVHAAATSAADEMRAAALDAAPEAMKERSLAPPKSFRPRTTAVDERKGVVHQAVESSSASESSAERWGVVNQYYQAEEESASASETSAERWGVVHQCQDEENASASETSAEREAAAERERLTAELMRARHEVLEARQWATQELERVERDAEARVAVAERAAAGRTSGDHERTAANPEHSVPAQHEQRATAVATAAERERLLSAELTRARHELLEAKQEREEARKELQRVERDAQARIDAAERATDRAVAEQERAVAALFHQMAERERVAAERDHAAAERERATAERDRAAAEREQAAAERDHAAAAVFQQIAGAVSPLTSPGATSPFSSQSSATRGEAVNAMRLQPAPSPPVLPVQAAASTMHLGELSPRSGSIPPQPSPPAESHKAAAAPTAAAATPVFCARYRHGDGQGVVD